LRYAILLCWRFAESKITKPNHTQCFTLSLTVVVTPPHTVVASCCLLGMGDWSLHRNTRNALYVTCKASSTCKYLYQLLQTNGVAWVNVARRRPSKVTHFCNVVTSVLWCHEFQTRMECHVTIYGHSTPSLSMWVFVWQGSLRLESDRDVCLLFSDNISYARSVSEC